MSHSLSVSTATARFSDVKTRLQSEDQRPECRHYTPIPQANFNIGGRSLKIAPVFNAHNCGSIRQHPHEQCSQANSLFLEHTRQLNLNSQAEYRSHSKISLNSELSGFDSRANVKTQAMAEGCFDHVE